MSRKTLSITFLILQTLDIVITHYCLQTGLIKEINPLMEYIFNNYTIIGAMGFKLLVSAGLLLIGFKVFYNRLKFYLILANSLMILVLLINTISYLSVQ